MQPGWKWTIGILLFAAGGSCCAYGQFQVPTKEELTMSSDAKAPGADAVILYREETENDAQHYRSFYTRIKVLTEAGKEASTVHIPYPHGLLFYSFGVNSMSSSGGINGASSSINTAVSSATVGTVSSTTSGSGTASTSQSALSATDHSSTDRPQEGNGFNVKVEVGALEGRVIHADGSVVPLPAGTAANLKWVNTPAGKEAVFVLPGAEVGSILEYRYQVRYDRYQSAPVWQIQQPYFIHKVHYLFDPAEIFHPGRMQGGAGVTDAALLDIHHEHMTDVQSQAFLPQGKQLGKDALERYYVDLTDVPPLPRAVYAPAIRDVGYHVNFFYVYTLQEKEYWQREMQHWMKDLDRYTSAHGALQSEVSELLAGESSSAGRAQKLYALVQSMENTDLSGGGEKSAVTDAVPAGSVEDVLRQKSGNRNQLAFLYYALARQAGLSARPERIASRNLHIFSSQKPDTEQLDSVLIVLSLDGKEVVLDPGAKMAPFGTLHWSHAAAGGIAMGANGRVENIVTHEQSAVENNDLRVGTLTVSGEGNIGGALKVAFTGQKALELRQMAVRSGTEAVRAQLNQELALAVPEGVQASVEQFGGMDDSNRQLVAVVRIHGKLPVSQGKVQIPRALFAAAGKNPLPEDPARTLPIDMYYPSQAQERITWTLPTGFSAEVPQDTVLRYEDGAAFQLHSKVEGNSVLNARLLAIQFTLLEAARYNALRDYLQKVTDADRGQVPVHGSAGAQ